MESLSSVISKIGLPTRKTETWKYTSVKSIFESQLLNSPLSVSDETKSSNNGLINDLKIEGFDNIIFINGVLSDLSDNTKFEISRTEFASNDVSQNNAHGLNEDFAANLNYSTIKEGHHFELAPNTNLDTPVAIIHLHDSSQNDYLPSHNTFKIGKNSSVNVIEIYLSSRDTQSLVNFATDIYVEKNAKFVHVHCQSLHEKINYFNSCRSQICANGLYENFNFIVGGNISRSNVHIDLNETGAQCSAHGTYTLLNQQHSDSNSFIHHKAAHTYSNQLYKGILSGKSRGVFTGLIKVDKDAQLIESNQLNKNLLLSKGAHSNSRPQLEIFADDVKCSHGSTTGQLSEEEIFYFAARGIREHQAKKILSHAFSYDVVLKIQDKKIRHYIQRVISDKFETKAFSDQTSEVKNA